MLNKLKTDYVSWILLIGAFFLILDVFFFNRGLIFSLIVATGMVFVGRKRMPKKTGKFLYWAGLVFLVINAFNMLSIRFFFVALLCVFIVQFGSRKQNPTTIHPIIKQPEESTIEKETIVKEKPLLQNYFFGGQKTPEHVYEWKDVNIQGGMGDTVIDFSYTVLPKGETITFIRNVIGKVTILIPYDVEVSVNHSAIYGSAKILDFYESQAMNRQVKVETAQYEQADQKVKVFTSMLVGDIEVKRV
ncbi:cell wall-active antibiotics response protein LiaF [Niallia sp. Krafla_26]|uniref:cell wall-active antibiotics response protein LiaF n=1 Tax=Niallia sp. Krafla_26 TaxID=3064703 RepID=UPI003D172BE6